MMHIEYAPTRSDKIAVVLGHLLYATVFRVSRGRGAVRLGQSRWANARRVVVREGAATLTLPALDFYWARHIYGSLAYEEEVDQMLRILGGIGRTTFVDCGANFGYWSARVIAGDYGEHEVLAIEASKQTYEVLTSNIEENAEVVLAAVSDSNGFVSFDDTLLHAARQISDSGDTRVPSVTLDSLTEGKSPVIVKLDVEGAEVAALRGASELLKRDVAFVYEDHGKDMSCAASKAMLEARLTIFTVVDHRAVRVDSLEEIAKSKKDPEHGYNFVACNGAFLPVVEASSDA